MSSVSEQKKGMYAVVSCDVLPEVFIKVIEAKRLLACGEEKSFASACKRIGLSRSAFYKYKDSVFTYEEKLKGRIISLYAALRDEPGVLSAMLVCLHECGANILTLNQSIPVDGAAAITVTVRLSQGCGRTELTDRLAAVTGVVAVRLLSEE